MPKYRKRPIIVEAERWWTPRIGPGGDRTLGVRPYMLDEDPRPCQDCCCPMQEHGWIETLEGGHIVCPGDWIVTRIRGERYPVKNAIFEVTYEPVEESDD